MDVFFVKKILLKDLTRSAKSLWINRIDGTRKSTINIPNPSGLVIPDILQQSSLNTGTIEPSDRSQLAKSGDNDIPEAIANRG